MVHPDATAVHTRTHWRACQTSCAIKSTDDPSKLLEWSWANPTEGTWRLYARDEDDLGRLGDWSEPVECTVAPPPPQLVVTSHVGGAVVSTSVLLEWEAPYYPEEGGWNSVVELSNDGGTTWSQVQSGELESYFWDSDGLAMGTYYFRFRACYPGTSYCGDWIYLPLTIDRTGLTWASYDFTAIVEFPESWEVLWDGVSRNAHWELVDKELGQDGPPIGILARLSRRNVERTTSLVMKEFGQPTLGRATVQVSILGREDMWYFWRYAYAHLAQAGVAWQVRGKTGESDRGGLLGLVSSGNQPWPCPTVACSCTAMSDQVCLGCRAATLDRNQNNPDTLHQYAVSYRRAGVRYFGRNEPNSSTPSYRTSETVEPDGDRARGMTVARREDFLEDPENPDEPSGCLYRPIWYTVEQWVTRVSEGYRYRLRVLGPGLDPTQGWPIDRILTDAQWATIGCGYCGLGFYQLRGLDQTIGALYRSMTLELPEGLQATGPIYGTPTVEVTS
jgi:hypothetical protein